MIANILVKMRGDGGTSAKPNPGGGARLEDWLKPSGSTRRGGKKK